MNNKIAIIGGGFYGCYLSIFLSDVADEVHVYEKNEDILQEAISNNQQRLHKGFHYPRCDFTIKQSRDCFSKFVTEFEDAIEDVPHNLYVIHKDSLINYSDYVLKMREHGLEFSEESVEEYSNLFANPSNIEGILKTKEKKINLKKLKNIIKKTIYQRSNIKIHTNTEILDKSKLNLEFNFVINCTYTNPEILLERGNSCLKVKHELCFVPLIKVFEQEFFNKSITIMDGNFCSLYGTSKKDIFSISNVLYTPFFKSYDSKFLYKIQKDLTERDIETISLKIIKESKKHIKLKNYELVGCRVSQKCKILEDVGAYRGSYCIMNKNDITVIAGKISAVTDIAIEIRNFIK